MKNAATPQETKGFVGTFDVKELAYVRKDWPVLTCISLFSGAGGFDLGTHAAGFETRVMVEWEKAACDTLRYNWTGETRTVRWKGKRDKKWRDPAILERDITKLTSKEILEAAELRVGEASLLTGGFPCQGFSTAGKRDVNDHTKDERNFLYKECVRVIRETLPKTFALENVKGLISMEKGKVIRMICDDLAGCGYNVTWHLLDAADYGVPQHRERVFFMGERVDVLALKGDRPQLHIGGMKGEVFHPEWFKLGISKGAWEKSQKAHEGQGRIPL